MATDHEVLAQEVVTAFMETLDPKARDLISKAQREELELLVREAVAEAVSDTLERVEDLVKQLRSETSRPQLEL